MDEATVKAMLEQHFTGNDPKLSHEGLSTAQKAESGDLCPERTPRGES
jgi:hypothetical protein